MILAEWKKLMHNRTFCFFLGILLILGLLSPLLSGTETGTREAYAAYAGHSPEAIIADIEERLEQLDICRTLELNATLPAEIAQMLLESLIQEYGLTEVEMEALDLSQLLRFTDDAQSESQLLESVKAQAQRAAGYPDYLASIRTQEETIRNSILYRNNAYALSLAGKTAECYAGLDGLTLPFSDPTGVEKALGTWIDDVIGCAVVCLTAMFAFLQERQEGMIPLLFSTRRGRRATFAAKTGTVVLLGGASCVVFALFRLVLSGDLGDLSRPVQTIPAFYTSPYSISVGTMLWLLFLQRLAATVFVGLLMSLLCITLDRSLALGAGALIAGVEVLCWNLIDSSSVLQPVKYLSIPALFSDETLLGNAVFVKLFGFPVNFVHTSLFLLIVLGVSLLILGGHCYANTHRALSIPSRPRKRREKKRIPGLFPLELRKLMVHQKAALLLLLIIALQPRFYDSFYARITADELRYLSAVKSVEGEYTAEKHESLRTQKANLEAQLAQTTDPLMCEELNDRILALEQVLALSNYLASREEPVSYVYETGFEAMFGQRSVGVRYQPGLIALSLCLMLPGLFTLEKETGISGLVSTTSGNRRLRKIRWRIVMMISFGVFLVCWVPEAWFIGKAFDLAQWNAPAVSLQMFAELPGWIPLWLSTAGLWLTRLAWALGCGAVTAWIAEKTGRYLPTVLLSGGILLIFLLIL